MNADQHKRIAGRDDPLEGAGSQFQVPGDCHVDADAVGGARGLVGPSDGANLPGGDPDDSAGDVSSDDGGEPVQKKARTELALPVRRKNDGLTISGYLNETSLRKLNGDYPDLKVLYLNIYYFVYSQDYAGWSYLTHIVYTGLQCSADGVVSYNGDPLVWMSLLNHIRRRFPYLKVFLAFPHHAYLDLVKHYESDKFWESLIHAVKRFDGFLMNIEGNKTLPATFKGSLINLKTHCPVWVVINNTLSAYPESYIESLKLASDRLIINSFNFIKHSEERSNRETIQNVLPQAESALADFNKTQRHYHLSERKVLMGIDTCGVRFQLNETGFAHKMWMLPLHEIERLKIVGVKPGSRPENRTYKFKEYYDKESQSSLLKLSGEREIISFDNYRVRKCKVSAAAKLGGVCIGELVHDLHPLHPRALLQMAYVKMAVLGLDNMRNNVE